MTFYITTPIYYVNDTPHIGHAYTTVVADILARYHRLFGHETYFLTGTDEHGQKVQNKAKELQRDPLEYVNEMAPRFQAVWSELNIQYDIFMRTTFPYHIKAVQDGLQKLFDKGDIYTKTYGGWYCVSEEIFFTDKDIKDGKCPQGHNVQHVEEKNYFFAMSKYQQRLIDYINTNKDFILPEYRKNEVLGFLRQPLEDLCISRPKNRLSWGIELPFDKDYVTYVWFDALMNYATALGLYQPGKDEKFNKFWRHAIHLIGKDILTTHAVYWPTMLMAQNIPLPKTIFAHGWWLTEGNQKMSKSLGPVVKPLDMKNVVGADALRYFLARDINLGNDAQFSQDLVISRVNAELANNLGNLLSRSTNLVSKYFGDKVPSPVQTHDLSKALAASAVTVAEKVKQEILDHAPNLALGHVVDLLNEANKYLENMAPWKSAKTDLKITGEVLYTALEVLRIAGILMHPVMPSKMNELLKRVGWASTPRFEDAKKWGLLQEGAAVEKGDPLFPRVEAPATA
ncbi:MAG TPA: methionine--tRNA ligase [Bdellovibrionales bacterium]|nr:methionine--tRNA ligase [Bdellovibrionales bacterium]